MARIIPANEWRGFAGDGLDVLYKFKTFAEKCLTVSAIGEQEDFVRDEILVNGAQHGARVGGVWFARDDDLLGLREAELSQFGKKGRKPRR